MRRILITGGNSGMGRSAAELFLQHGDMVTVTSRSVEKAERMLIELAAYTDAGMLHFCRCDSSKADDVERMRAFVETRMGGCDVLVNSAAVFIGGELHTVSEADYDLLMDIDVKGVFLTSRAVLPGMLAQGGGALIAVSSLAGVRGNYNCPIYCAAKAAVNNMTRCMALDYGTRGIRANAVCPSATQTDMFLCGSTREVVDAFHRQNPMGRISTPEEIARLVFFLASDDASFINGQCISIDGGLSAWAGEPRQDKTEQRK